MSQSIRPIPKLPKKLKRYKSQRKHHLIQFNIMSTMSELHRLMQEIKADDLDILADIAYQQENAMREEMDEPDQDIDPVYEQFIDNHPEALL